MDREEIKYNLELGGWWEDRHGNFHRLVDNKETRIRFHKDFRITAEYRSRFKQWVIFAETYDRHVRRYRKFLIIDEFETPVRK